MARVFAKLLLVLLAGCAALPLSLPSRRDKVALVIGNSAYENATPLVNPVNDANDMCAKLRGIGFRTLCHTNLRERADFEARVAEYIAQLKPNSIGIVFYSGHGVQVGEANFLIPTQVQPKSAGENPLRVLYGLNELFDRMREKPAEFQFVVLDACRTDLFAAAPAAAGRGAASRSMLVRALEGVPRAGYGLAPITNGPPRTKVLFATASKEAASDGDGRNGPLTKHVLRNIATVGQTVDQLVTEVTKGVESEPPRPNRKPQTPFVYGSSGREVCFAGCGSIVSPTN